MKNRYADIPVGFYKNLSYEMEVIVTGESLDTGARVSALRGILDLFAVQPQSRNDPAMKRVITEMMELVGLDPGILDTSPAPEAETPPLPRGGTLPKQASAGAPVMNQTPVTL